MSTLSTNSTSSALSPKLSNFRGRSTSFSSAPQASVNVPHTPSHYRSVSMSSQSSFGVPGIAGNKQQPHQQQQQQTLTTPSSSRLRHRKSHSADLHHLATDVPDVYVDQYGTSSGNSNDNNSRRNSLTPSVVIRPPIVLPSQREMNRRSLDITNDWMLANSGKPSYHHHHQQQPSQYAGTGRPASFGSLHTNHMNISTSNIHINNNSNNNTNNNNNNNVGHSRPIISTTFPTISNSSPLPGFCTSPPTSTTSHHSNNSGGLSSPPSSSSPSSIRKFEHHTTNDARRLARSLSSTSSLFSKKLNHPPEIINIRNKPDGLRRPASICIDPRSMHHDDEDETEDDLMGDFLRGLQSLDGDIVGERTGSYRTVRRL
ncbi:hypothetical protein BDA99DRAFT_193728 [Phascolomyces articulosus]|uniref:Uncharacterized protein n=1 Tax=Phascolomyces articulosus TaxID=60185 RepID=A0AAD5PJ17_9FUNG|nr:hypothetical protein BDA99DRAFT_193728 [Phascolomyces articulosus]